jgi:hypothetical protein
MNQQGNATRAIAGALQELIDGVRPQGWNYLIVTSGHAYVQFSRDWGEQSMLVEAVSNFYLDKNRQLNSAAVQALRGMAFEDPDREVTPAQCRTSETADEVQRGSPRRSTNFFRYFEINAPGSVAALASLTVTVLESVYGTQPARSLKLELSLGVGQVG